MSLTINFSGGGSIPQMIATSLAAYAAESVNMRSSHLDAPNIQR
jgi:hypothetical protein